MKKTQVNTISKHFKARKKNEIFIDLMPKCANRIVMDKKLQVLEPFGADHFKI